MISLQGSFTHRPVETGGPGDGGGEAAAPPHFC